LILERDTDFVGVKTYIFSNLTEPLPSVMVVTGSLCSAFYQFCICLLF